MSPIKGPINEGIGQSQSASEKPATILVLPSFVMEAIRLTTFIPHSHTLPFAPFVFNHIMNRPYRERTRLPDDFLPSRWDVLCGRGTSYRNHWGNRQLRAVVDQHLEQYISSETKLAKTHIINCITESIRETGNCRFVNYDERLGYWYEIGDQLAREKVGHAMRDAKQNKKRKAEVECVHVTQESQAQYQELLRTQQRLFLESLIEDQQRNNATVVVNCMDQEQDAVFRRQQQIFQESLNHEEIPEQRARKRARHNFDEEGWC